MKKDIVICGIGGQGVITMVKLLLNVANRHMLKVVSSETHGMSQRGGSVISHVRMGRMGPPTVPQGKADILVSLEPSETIRYLHFANKNTKVISNSRKIFPFSISPKKAIYPDFPAILESYNSYIFDATAIAEKIGSYILTNMVMLGFVSNLLPFDKEVFIDEIKRLKKLRKDNIKAFEEGRKYGKNVL